MADQWETFLEPYFGQRCSASANIGYCGEHFQPDVFDAERHQAFVSSYIDDVIGSWDFAAEQFGTKPGELVMFAANVLGGQVDAVLFYDRKSGQVYKYEEADYCETGFRLDKLGLIVQGATPNDAAVRR